MREEGRGFKRVHKQIGEARPLNQLKIALGLYPHTRILALFAYTWETVP